MSQLVNRSSDAESTVAKPVLSAVPADSVWSVIIGQWKRSLAGRNLSATTIRNYTGTLTAFAAFAIASDADEPEDVDAGLIEDFMIHSLGRVNRGIRNPGRVRSASSAATDYRHLRVFYNWFAEKEDLISPMTKTKAPKIEERLPEVFTDEELRALVGACKGRGFTERRDAAIMRMLLDTGVRRAELAGMTLAAFDLDSQVVSVIGKGDRERLVPYGAKTAEALDDYLRARAKHPARKEPSLWLAAPPHRKPLGYDGVVQVVKRRAELAGVTNVYPHRFRHTAADAFLSRGGSEGDAMRLFGWKTRAMVDRYGASAAGRRAVAAARKISAGDRI